MRTCYWALAVVLAAGIVACGVHGGWDRRDSPGGPTLPAEDVLPAEDGAPFPVTRVLAARLADKERAVHALLAGDSTLLEAAARFRELDAREPPVLPERHPEVYAGDTEAEKYCRAVIFWADNAARSCPSGGGAGEAAAVVRRLEDELEGRRLCGTLTLPAPPRPAACRAGAPAQ